MVGLPHPLSATTEQRSRIRLPSHTPVKCTGAEPPGRLADRVKNPAKKKGHLRESKRPKSREETPEKGDVGALRHRFASCGAALQKFNGEDGSGSLV